jgi:hypothetical protein
VFSTLIGGRPAFIDFSVGNFSPTAITQEVVVHLLIDGQVVARGRNAGIAGWQGGAWDDIEATLPAGRHSIRIVLDPDNRILESDESNNVWEGDFLWNSVTIQSASRSRAGVSSPPIELYGDAVFKHEVIPVWIDDVNIPTNRSGQGR